MKKVAEKRPFLFVVGSGGSFGLERLGVIASDYVIDAFARVNHVG